MAWSAAEKRRRLMAVAMNFQGWEINMDCRLGRDGRIEPGGRPASRARVAGALTFLVLGIATGPGAIGSAITIMPLGDSVTLGYSDPVDVPGGYRSVLFRDLTSAGYTPTFVGSQTTNPDPTLPAAAQAHEGHGGWLIAGDGGYATFSLANKIDEWLAPGNGIKPDLILVEAGSNEIYGKYHVASSPYELAALVTRISELRPNAEILLSTIPPQADVAREAQVQAFNTALGGPDGIVAQLQKRGEKVVLVNAGGSLAASTDLSHDGLHPNQAGYTQLGHAWFDAIQAFEGSTLGLPGPAPEPSTLAVLGVGLLGLFAVRRSRLKPSLG